MLPTSKDDCRHLASAAWNIASIREKGISLQRFRAEYIKVFARDTTHTVFPPIARASMLGWLADDLYGPSAFLSLTYASRATEVWCQTILTTARPERIPFTLALLPPVLVDAIKKCTSGYGLGSALVRLRNRGLPLADAMLILREGITHGILLKPILPRPLPPNYDILKGVDETRHIIDENVRVMSRVATAIYADSSLTETTIDDHLPRICAEIWLP